MGTINLQIPESGASLEELANIVAMLAKELAYLLDGNLDLANLRANSVTADRIKAGTITATQIAAGTITANKLSVSQLSAIAADLGTITAGIIYGAYIATSNGTYPRIEFNSVGNLLTAFLDANNSLSIMPNLGGVPALRFTNASIIVGHLSAGGSLALSSSIDIDIVSSKNINISAATNVNFDNWSYIKNGASGHTLQTDLDAKQNTITGYTGSFVSGTKTVTVSNGIITSVV